MPQTRHAAKLDNQLRNTQPKPHRQCLCGFPVYGLNSLLRTLHLPRSPPASHCQAPQHVSHPSPGFPFLALPRELREMIYDYFRDVPVAECKRMPTLTPTGEWIFFDQFSHNRDRIHQMPFRSGFLAYHGAEPPFHLALTCKQVYAELWDHTFEVGPLTPHSDEWRFDPTYRRLAMSTRLPDVRKILIKIELARLQMRTVHGGIRYTPIELEECILKVQPLAEMLVRVLRNRASCLRLISIDWVDDFAKGKELDWELKASVLLPFGTLEKVQIRLNRLLVDSSAKVAAEKMLDETLDGLSAV